MIKRVFPLAIVVVGALGAFSQPAITLSDHPVKLKNRAAFNLKIPAGYKSSVAAEGLRRPRFFSKSPDGRLFITDMYSPADNKKGRVLILADWDDQKRQFGKIITYLDSLHNPNQVAFYTVNNQHYIYIAETGKLSYYRYNAGDTAPSSPATVIATFPGYGLDYKYGGWHLTRSIRDAHSFFISDDKNGIVYYIWKEK